METFYSQSSSGFDYTPILEQLSCVATTSLVENLLGFLRSTAGASGIDNGEAQKLAAYVPASLPPSFASLNSAADLILDQWYIEVPVWASSAWS